MVQRTGDVPQYVLYGEQDSKDSLEFFHIETIASRSRAHDWLIRPHQHGRMHQLLFVKAGRVRAWLDEKEYLLEGPGFISVPPGIVHSFQFAPDTQGEVLTVAEALLNHFDDARTRQYLEGFCASPTTIHIESKSPVFLQLQQNVQQIHDEFYSRNAGRHLLSEWLLQIVFLQLSREVSQQPANAATSPETDALHSFRTLIERHFADQWKVEDYAVALNMPPARLNRICKFGLNKNAKALIQERLCLEAKRKLTYTQTPIEKIAFDLGFRDPAYFSRAFRQWEGVSPRLYRDTQNLLKNPGRNLNIPN